MILTWYYLSDTNFNNNNKKEKRLARNIYLYNNKVLRDEHHTIDVFQ